MHYVLVFLFIYGATYSLQRYWGIPNYLAINFHSLQASWDLILLRYIVAFSGSLGIIAVISFLYKYFAECSFLNNMSHYGQWTLGVYVLQTILVANVFPDTLAWYVESELLLDAVVAPLLSVGFLALCLWLIYWLSKNKTIDLLMFGGQYYKR